MECCKDVSQTLEEGEVDFLEVVNVTSDPALLGSEVETPSYSSVGFVKTVWVLT